MVIMVVVFQFLKLHDVWLWSYSTAKIWQVQVQVTYMWCYVIGSPEVLTAIQLHDREGKL